MLRRMFNPVQDLSDMNELCVFRPLNWPP